MCLLKLVIILDQPVYYSGQILSGRLFVEVDKPMSVKAIYLRYSGRADVHWTETERYNNETKSVSYNNSEDYLMLQQHVFGNDSETSELAEGEHVFLFSCQLPMYLPNSFEGSYGKIRYKVKATIDRPWKFNHVAVQPFTVMSVADLNLKPFAVAPIDQQISKTFWGHSNQLWLSINVPIRGFVPGQIIPIKVSINNGTGVQVKMVKVSLKQWVKFHATSKTRTTRNNVFKNEFPVPKGFGREDVPLSFQLPAVPPSYLEFCKIIDITYELGVTARVDGWYHRNLKIRTELIVGNVPLMNYQRPIQHELFNSNETFDRNHPSHSHQQPPAYGFALPSEMQYENLPPPSYEQCMNPSNSERKKPDDRDDDSDNEVKEFAPLYPVYKFEDHKWK